MRQRDHYAVKMAAPVGDETRQEATTSASASQTPQSVRKAVGLLGSTRHEEVNRRDSHVVSLLKMDLKRLHVGSSFSKVEGSEGSYQTSEFTSRRTCCQRFFRPFARFPDVHETNAWLRFASKDEQRFQAFQLPEVRKRLRLSLIFWFLSTVLVLIFDEISPFGLYSNNNVYERYTAITVLVFALIIFGLQALRPVKLHTSWLTKLVCLVAGATSVVINYQEIRLISIFLPALLIYSISGASFRWATLVMGLTTVAFLILDIIRYDSAEYLAVNILVYCAINLYGFLYSYSQELWARRVFLKVVGLAKAQSKIASEVIRSDQLLLSILPKKILRDLKSMYQKMSEEMGDPMVLFRENTIHPQNNVTVLFADIVGFTVLSSSIAPERVVQLLNEIFTQFDRLVEKYGLEKIKTLGDCYMACGGMKSTRCTRASVCLTILFS